MVVDLVGAIVGGVVGGLVYLFVMRSRAGGRTADGRTSPAVRWAAAGMGIGLFVVLLVRPLLTHAGWAFLPALLVALIAGIAAVAVVSLLYTRMATTPGRHRR